jgi:hypothetical protein
MIKGFADGPTPPENADGSPSPPLDKSELVLFPKDFAPPVVPKGPEEPKFELGIEKLDVPNGSLSSLAPDLALPVPPKLEAALEKGLLAELVALPAWSPNKPDDDRKFEESFVVLLESPPKLAELPLKVPTFVVACPKKLIPAFGSAPVAVEVAENEGVPPNIDGVATSVFVMAKMGNYKLR